MPAATMPPPDPTIARPEPDPCWGFSTGITNVATAQQDIDALAGCEELYGLNVYGTALDLRPLAALRRVSFGGLHLEGVRALDGLENLTYVEGLSLSGPSIGSVRPLASLQVAQSLMIRLTSLVDLTGLENVAGLTDINIENNPQLQSLAGLRVADNLYRLALIDNAVLSDITSLAGVRAVSFLGFVNNPGLSLPAFTELTSLDEFTLTGTTALQDVPAFPLLTAISWITIERNVGLERFNAFPALEAVLQLYVFDNPNLVELSLPQLRQAEGLSIVYNPRLDGVAVAASLANVSSPGLRIAPDQTQAILDPCPWTADDICDEYRWCAAYTDPVCR